MNGMPGMSRQLYRPSDGKAHVRSAR